MRQTREILRQKWVLACSHRQVAASLWVNFGTVAAVLRRAAHAGLDWAQVQQLCDDAIEARLYGAPATPSPPAPRAAEPLQPGGPRCTRRVSACESEAGGSRRFGHVA